MVDSVSVFRCPFCPCWFCSQSDLDGHLKRFGNVPHLRLWECVHILFEVDGHNAGVDDHGEWSWRDVRSYDPSTVQDCRKLLKDRGFVL